ncbi:MAG: hypothetical protein P0120_07550 [Nitrospira sp.]|nr:hypothetical protein [Nitrospira sp.]
MVNPQKEENARFKVRPEDSLRLSLSKGKRLQLVPFMVRQDHHEQKVKELMGHYTRSSCSHCIKPTPYSLSIRKRTVRLHRYRQYKGSRFLLFDDSTPIGMFCSVTAVPPFLVEIPLARFCHPNGCHRPFLAAPD